MATLILSSDYLLIDYSRIIKRVWDLIIDSNRHLEFAQEHGTLAIAQTSKLTWHTRIRVIILQNTCVHK